MSALLEKLTAIILGLAGAVLGTWTSCVGLGVLFGFIAARYALNGKDPPSIFLDIFAVAFKLVQVYSICSFIFLYFAFIWALAKIKKKNPSTR